MKMEDFRTFAVLIERNNLWNHKCHLTRSSPGDAGLTSTRRCYWPPACPTQSRQLLRQLKATAPDINGKQEPKVDFYWRTARQGVQVEYETDLNR